MKLTILCLARGGEAEVGFLRALADIGGALRAEFVIAAMDEPALLGLPVDLTHYVVRARGEVVECLGYCTGDFVLCIESAAGSWMARRDPGAKNGWQVVPSQAGGSA